MPPGQGASLPSVVAIFGPTASGKSAVAAAVAEMIGGTLIGADAMQVYDGLPILTNQPREPTELVGIWPLEHEASIGEYAPLAHDAIDRARSSGGTAIVVGGTGLYLRAALAELDIPPRAPAGVRSQLEVLYDDDAGATAYRRLVELDPAAAAAIHVNDRRRVVRALELAGLGRSLRPSSHALWTETVRHPTIVIGLEIDRELLEQRIATRTQAMFTQGVREEAQRALGRRMSTTALKVIGLREAAELERADAIELINEKTRRYAAYQRKWMRRIPNVCLVAAAADPIEVANEVLQVARSRQ